MLFVNRSRHDKAKSTPLFPSALILAAVFAVCTITGCDRSQIQYYRIPKEKPALGQVSEPPSSPTHDSTNRVVEPRLVMPSTWKAETPGQMQVARYSMSADGRVAEATITTFPGDVGGLFANINRWRSQIGLEPISQDQISQVSQPLELNGARATLVDLVNPQNQRRLISVIVPRDGQTWFFKLLGDESLAEREKEQLVNMVKNAW